MSPRPKQDAIAKRVGKTLKLALVTDAGRRFSLEEVQAREHPVARWWSPERKNHSRVTIPVRVRGGDGRLDASAVQQAQEMAIAEVSRLSAPNLASASTDAAPAPRPREALTGSDEPYREGHDPSVSTLAPAQRPDVVASASSARAIGSVATLGEAVALATGKAINRRVSERWRADLERYGRVAVTILGADMPALDIGAAEFRRVYEAVADTTRCQLDALQHGQEALAQFARSSALASALTGIAAEEFERGIDGDEGDDDQPIARQEMQRSVAVAAELLVGRTARRELAVKLVNGVRTILRRAAEHDDKRFKGCESVTLPQGIKDNIYALWRDSFEDFGLSDKPARERYSKTVAVQMLHALRDPRAQMHCILSMAVGGAAALRVRWRDIQVKPDALGVRELTDKKLGNWTWRWVRGPGADVFRKLLEGGYATTLYGRSLRLDDLLIPTGRWIGFGETPFVRDATPFELDPRMQVLYDCFAEKRLGQAVRLMRSQITPVEGVAGLMVATLPDVGKKRGFTQLFCPVQLESIVLAWTIGPLRELEAAYREGKIRDYPMFPGGKLRAGCAPAERAGSLVPMDRRTISKHCAKLERMVGIAPVLTDAERDTLRQAKGKRRDQSIAAESIGEDHPLVSSPDAWKSERPVVGNYGLRRALIDLAMEWDVPAHVADLLSCHVEPVKVEQGRQAPHGRGTRTGIYMNTFDTQLLLQAAKVMQRARTQRYTPMWLGFDDEDL